MNLIKKLCCILPFIVFSAYSQSIKEINITAPIGYFEVVPKNHIDKTINPYINQGISANNLNSIVETVTNLFRRHGFMGCQAYIPEQDASDGKITIAVDNLKVLHPRVENKSTISSDILNRLLFPARNLPCESITDTKKNDHLLKARDLNAFDIDLKLIPTTQEDVDRDPTLGADLSYYKSYYVIKNKKTFDFDAYADNYGQKNTGKERFTAVLNSNNLFNNLDKGVFALSSSSKGQVNGFAEYSKHIGYYFKFLGLSINAGAYDIKDQYSDFNVKGKQICSELFFSDNLFRDSFTKSDYKLGSYLRFLSDKFSYYDIELKRRNYGSFIQLFTEHVNFENDIIFTNNTRVSLSKTDNIDDYNLYKTSAYGLLTTNSTLSFYLNTNLSLDTELNLQLSSNYIDPIEKMNAGGAYAVKAYQSNLASGDMGIFNSFGCTYHFNDPLNLQLGSALMQSHIRNFHGKTESFYGLSLNGHMDINGFYTDISISKAVGKHQKLAEDKLSALVKFGYTY